MTFSTRSTAFPLRIPVSLPLESLPISPSGGVGVDSSMPASFKAREFARCMLRSNRLTSTGCSAVDASMRARSGVNGPDDFCAADDSPLEPAPHCS